LSVDSAETSQSLTQAERTAISDKAMLEAAIDLILERGTDKTTLAAIGDKAGYSRGLATYRFGSKAGLFDEVCKSISHRWLSYLMRDVGELVGVEAMCAALDCIYRFTTESPRDAQVLQILYCGAGSPTSEYRPTAVGIHQKQQDDVADWIRAGIENGSVRGDVDPALAATQYIAYITGMTYLRLINPDSTDFLNANDGMKEHLKMSLGSKQFLERKKND
jgi:AcrR family transcriptional regulator